MVDTNRSVSAEIEMNCQTIVNCLVEPPVGGGKDIAQVSNVENAGSPPDALRIRLAGP